MSSIVEKFGRVPIRSSVIGSLYPNHLAKHQKVMNLEKAGVIIRLKKGLYVASPREIGRALSTELIANHIYSPSYVSKSSAIRYYGLIPEAVYSVQSMTIKHSRVFENDLGRFEYAYVSEEVFSIGVTSMEDNGIYFLIATPEKALCDLIASSPKLNLRSLSSVEQYLRYDIRMDMEAFYRMDANIFQAYIDAGGKKSSSIAILIKFLNR